ncbi:helix-turn-helix transcriptional regulator [Sulfurivirga sp.]|uniref:helix-turn-helix domain-containing protein n=1 Tax=Sulfurivirga sp. TaxID=2614236 RepID=UPI0025DAE5C3|nr:helix-turn-helix transcriptional regulator [Sulfurivirga sp.]
MTDSKEIRETFRKRLRQAIKTRNLSAAQVARDLGLSVGSMQNYTKGLTLPPCSRMLDIARYFGRPIEYFLAADRESSRPVPDELDDASAALARVAAQLPEHQRYLLLDLAHELRELNNEAGKKARNAEEGS